MTSPTKRNLLFLLLLAFVAIEAYAALASGGGGWLAKHGFIGGFSAYFTLSTADPILLAGMVDFMTLMLIAGVWMISELPRETRWNGRTGIWLISYLVYPGLGAILYFLWLNPRHR